MNLTRDRVRSIGWAFVLTVCAALTAGLMLRVNAVKGQVHEAERRIVNLRHEIVFLETEFKTRANQQQLKTLNDVEFGYRAPRAEQYIEGERQLAALGKPRGPGAPKPIRVANAVRETRGNALLQMVSPLSGESATATATATGASAATAEAPVPAQPAAKPAAAEAPSATDPVADAIAAADVADRLGRIDLPAAEAQ